MYLQNQIHYGKRIRLMGDLLQQSEVWITKLILLKLLLFFSLIMIWKQFNYVFFECFLNKDHKI
jgi:hypothetical protein